MAGPQPMKLLDLPDDLLLRTLVHLPFDERLRLAEVCRRLHTLSAAPGELWREVNVQPLRRQVDGLAAGVHALTVAVARFKDWLRPRAAGVMKLTVTCPQVYGMYGSLPSYLLPSVPSMPLLSDLAIRWAGGADMHFQAGPALPALRALWLSVDRLVLSDAAAPPAFPGLDLCLFHGRLVLLPGAAGSARAWLPPGTTQLRLMELGLQGLPQALPRLAPTLRSLSVDRNGPLELSSLSRLTPLTRLEALDLGENRLERFPHEISALTNLKILFLHKLFPHDVWLEPADWDSLRPLTRLAFLSISSNHLRQLPPAVAGLSQLRALHIEDSQFREPLPAGAPCWANLVELLLDWGDALRGPGVLTAASRLTRLVLHNHLATLWAPAGQLVPPAELADPLLAALAAMPALRLLEDVVEPGQVAALTPPVARALLYLSRRLPARVELGQLRDTYIGWRLSSMPPEVAAAEAEAEASAAAAGTAGDAAAS